MTREQLHAESRRVAAAVAYVRSGKAPALDPAPRLSPEARALDERLLALFAAADRAADLEGLPVRRVAALPEHDPTPFLLSGFGQSERVPNRLAAA